MGVGVFSNCQMLHRVLRLKTSGSTEASRDFVALFGPPARKKHSGGAALAETDPGSCTDFRVSHPDCVGVPGSLTNRRRAEGTAQSATVRAIEAIR